jgi:predicted dehydrogenase
MPIKIALIGAGHMGKIHIEKLASLADVSIAGVADVDQERARELAQQYSVPSFKDFKKLFGKAQGVIIATPTDTHYEIARDFLESGTHVFIEKPITSSQEEANELIKLAKRKGLILQVGFLERFNPAFLRIVPLIKKPLLVECCRASGFTGRSTDIDVVLDLMIHDIDLILSIVQEEVSDIRAQGVSFVMDNLDAASARIEFANGCVANLNANRISAKKERTLTVFDRNQNLFIDLLNRRVVMTVKTNGGNIDTEEYLADQSDAVRHEISAFIESITKGTSPIVKGEDGLRALALADQIKQYIAENKP